MSHRPLLQASCHYSLEYLESLGERRVAPTTETLRAVDALGGPFPARGADPAAVLSRLHELGSPATVASSGGRYFGFVIGGALPVTLAANWLAGAWDQDTGLAVASPGASRIEEFALRWLLEALHLPNDCGVGFVTGATMANFTGLAAARHALLARAGWDVEAMGLYGAPEIRVVVGDEVHTSLLKALAMVGLGRERVTRVPTDAKGRMRADRVPPLDALTLLCVQAGNVNTGAFDPAQDIIPAARTAGAWVHVDGAFGLWARSAPGRASLARGFELADSWAVDAHKWLNVPYDSGLAFSRDAAALRSAMMATAAYLTPGGGREPDEYTPELSRRARGIEIWAALAALGREGLADLIERCCRLATRFADALREGGAEILNDVELNQVLVRFGDDETTRRVIAAVQNEGTCWCGGTLWQGKAAMRISVSSWATTADDIDTSAAAILRVARGVRAT
jgi:glutamate/tyrosine decarboxylase-like PLP-dependent enzyme